MSIIGPRPLLGFAVKLVVNCLVCNFVFLICFFRTDVFRETVQTLLNIIKKKRR